MLVYKFDVIPALKEAGYNTTRIRREKLLSESSMTKLRRGVMIGNIELNKICKLLDMQPGNIIKYVEDEEESH